MDPDFSPRTEILKKTGATAADTGGDFAGGRDDPIFVDVGASGPEPARPQEGRAAFGLPKPRPARPSPAEKKEAAQFCVGRPADRQRGVRAALSRRGGLHSKVMRVGRAAASQGSVRTAVRTGEGRKRWGTRGAWPGRLRIGRKRCSYEAISTLQQKTGYEPDQPRRTGKSTMARGGFCVLLTREACTGESGRRPRARRRRWNLWAAPALPLPPC